MRLLLLFFLTINLYAIESIAFFEDKTKKLEIEEIIKLKNNFIKIDSNRVNFELSKSTFWIKLNFENDSEVSKNKILKIFPPFMEHIDLYDISKEIKIFKNGSSINLKDRNIKESNIIFDIHLKPNESKEFFLRVESQTIKVLIFEIFENLREYRYDAFKYDIFYSFLFGILTLAIIYNFFIYFYIKDKIFITYVLFVFVQIIFLLHYSGFILNFIETQKFLLIYTLSQFLILIFLILLIKEFFELSNKFKFYNKIFNAFIVIVLLTLTISFFDINLANRIKNPYLIPLLNLIILIFFIKLSIANKNKITLLFAFGWLIYIFSASYTILATKGFIEGSFISINSISLGILFEAILFSILLSYKFHLLKDEKLRAIKESANKEKILIQQSKMAQMGEMISAISHQWRQPLNSLALIIQNFKLSNKRGKLSDEKIDELVKNSLEKIYFMSQTIDDFKNFFSPNKSKESFSIKEAIEESISIIASQLKNNNIELIREFSDFTINGYKNEFKQVILNILNNAKDAIIVKGQNYEGKIVINISKNEDSGEIVIIDNGIGIPKKIMDKIFEPYFSTKEEKGTGIGLYMSKIIVENHLSGTIKATNIKNGTKFTITLNLK